MTRVAVMSDTHLPRGGRRLADECISLLADADLILHAGDLTAASVLDELRSFAPVHAVRGNMDDNELQGVLPERLVAEIAGARIGMIHDPGPREGRAERLAARFPDCHAVVYGHTHVPEVTRHGPLWILNPGSPTERRSAPSRSLLALEVDDGVFRPRLVRWQ
jgi:putative phosphoesterase